MKKNIQKKSARKIANLSLMVGKLAANSMCFYIYHQPKIPEELKKLRKF